MSTRLGFTAVLAGLLAAGALGHGAQAQSVGGNAFVSANCGGSTTRPLAVDGLGATACGSADFNGDGDIGTDADIEAFFRVLAGGTC